MLQVVRIQTFDWLKLRGCHAVNRIYDTCCKTSLPWVGKTRNRFSTNFVAKSRTSFKSLCNSPQQLLQPATTLFVAEQFWRIHSGKRTKSLFNSFWSKVSKQVTTSCTFLLPVWPYLKNIEKCIRVKVLFSVCLGVVTTFGKTSNKKVQFVLQHCCKTVEIKNDVARFTTLQVC